MFIKVRQKWRRQLATKTYIVIITGHFSFSSMLCISTGTVQEPRGVVGSRYQQTGENHDWGHLREGMCARARVCVWVKQRTVKCSHVFCIRESNTSSHQFKTLLQSLKNLDNNLKKTSSSFFRYSAIILGMQYQCEEERGKVLSMHMMQRVALNYVHICIMSYKSYITIKFHSNKHSSFLSYNANNLPSPK
jgi:hypothetical protein